MCRQPTRYVYQHSITTTHSTSNLESSPFNLPRSSHLNVIYTSHLYNAPLNISSSTAYLRIPNPEITTTNNNYNAVRNLNENQIRNLDQRRHNRRALDESSREVGGTWVPLRPEGNAKAAGPMTCSRRVCGGCTMAYD